MTVNFSSARWRKSSRSSGDENSTCVELTIGRWRKSSRSSMDENSECVEIGVAHWRKSGRNSMEENSTCVEVADLGTVVGIRDSKDPDGARLVLSPTAWRSLAQQIKRG